MSHHLKNGFRPKFDLLDTRRLMAARLTATLAQGVLTVRGTAAADVIAVDVQAQRGGIVAVSGVRKTFQASRVKRIEVIGGKGDDTIFVQTQGRQNLAIRINGGAGNDVINGVPEFPPVSPPVAQPVFSSAQPVSTIPLPSASSPSSSMQRIIDLTNAERLRAGLTPLAVSVPLSQAANIQSGNMGRLDVMSHTLPGTDQPGLADRAAAVGYRYTTLGENIAYNYADADAVVAGWMTSPGHRANILNAHFTEIGVSIAANTQGEPYYTQVFGSQT